MEKFHTKTFVYFAESLPYFINFCHILPYFALFCRISLNIAIFYRVLLYFFHTHAPKNKTRTLAQIFPKACDLFSALIWYVNWYEQSPIWSQWHVKNVPKQWQYTKYLTEHLISGTNLTNLIERLIKGIFILPLSLNDYYF